MTVITVTPEPSPEHPDALLVKIEGIQRDYWWKDRQTATNALTFQSRGLRLSAQAAMNYWNERN